MRIRRICSNNAQYDKCCSILKQKFTQRGYSAQLISSIINDVRKLDRQVLLQPKCNDVDDNNLSKTVYTPRLSLTFIPGITKTISNIIKKHWDRASDLFSFKLSFSYKNNTTIGDLISNKSRLQNHDYEIMDTPGPQLNLHSIDNCREKCTRRSCKTCDEHQIVPNSPHNTINVKNLKLTLPVRNINCESNNLIYMIICNKCECSHYIGETQQNLSGRMYGHRAKGKTLHKHFTGEGHTLKDMKVMVIHRLWGSAQSYSSLLHRRGVEYFYLRFLRPNLNDDLAPP